MMILQEKKSFIDENLHFNNFFGIICLSYNIYSYKISNLHNVKNLDLLHYYILHNTTNSEIEERHLSKILQEITLETASSVQIKTHEKLALKMVKIGACTNLQVLIANFLNLMNFILSNQ